MSKKDFKGENRPYNPAFTYLEPADPQEAQQAYERNQGDPVKSRRRRRPAPAPPEAEAKSRRVQLLMKPSLYQAVELRANSENMSVNAFIHELLEKEVSK